MSIFNVSMKKVGGLRFIKLGRITFTMSVTSRSSYLEKQAKEARQAVIDSMLVIDEACEDVIKRSLKLDQYADINHGHQWTSWDGGCSWMDAEQQVRARKRYADMCASMAD